MPEPESAYHAAPRLDHKLIGGVLSEVEDRVEVWRVTFEDPFPVRLRVIDCDGTRAEAWLGPNEIGELRRILEASC